MYGDGAVKTERQRVLLLKCCIPRRFSTGFLLYFRWNNVGFPALSGHACEVAGGGLGHR